MIVAEADKRTQNPPFMWFFTPKYLKEARHYRHSLSRVINYKRDLLAPHDLAGLERLKSDLTRAIRARDRARCAGLQDDIEKLVGKVAPPQKDAGWRENVEVIIVAIAIAAGVRAFVLQPFRIPTGSMQPTLYGVVGQRTDTPPPNPVRRFVEFIWLGRSYLNLVADQDVVVVGLKERTHLNFFTFTDIVCETKTYSVFAPAAPLAKAFGIQPRREYRAGEPIAVGYMDTGDQVFVDKVSYHFAAPGLGDVFVFRTTGIQRIQTSLPPGVESQHYIKRLCGLPLQQLEINSPRLLIDGQIPDVWTIQRVIRSENGYNGYANIRQFPLLNAPGESFTVPDNHYFALGDNSYHSSDSRYFGPVPERNLTGRGLFVYWPFSSRWGLIR